MRRRSVCYWHTLNCLQAKSALDKLIVCLAGCRLLVSCVFTLNFFAGMFGSINSTVATMLFSFVESNELQ
jgi:hypothetical protein